MGFLSNLRIAADTSAYAVKQLVVHPVDFAVQVKKYAWPDLRKILSNGITKVDEKEFNRRIDICYACDELLNKDTEYIRCQKCGCALNWKGRLDGMTCEAGKWDVKPEEKK